jgi:hypothetical protein
MHTLAKDSIRSLGRSMRRWLRFLLGRRAATRSKAACMSATTWAADSPKVKQWQPGMALPASAIVGGEER